MDSLTIWSDVILPIVISSAISCAFGLYLNYQTQKLAEQAYRRQQAEKVAALFAKWIKKPVLESGDDDHREELNRLTWEILLWIPDEKLVSEIMARLNNSENAKDIKEILLKVRTLMMEKKTTEIKADQVVNF